MSSLWTESPTNSNTGLLEKSVVGILKNHPMLQQELTDCLFCSVGEFYELSVEDLKKLPNAINNLIALGKISVRARPMNKNSIELELELFSTV